MKTSCFRVWRLLIELAGYLLPIARGPELRAQWVVDWWLSTRRQAQQPNYLLTSRMEISIWKEAVLMKLAGLCHEDRWSEQLF
uniref:Uncharacterized protein n=1 Tax=Oryza nivara TaxID=4536 RepID=A0A0E0I8F0_ORYNI